MSFSFKDHTNKAYTQRVEATAAIPEVDAITFLTSSKYLDERPFPFQSLTIKLLYGLWEKYPISPSEQAIIDSLQDTWGIDINLAARDLNQFIEVMILVIGRRGSKTSLISFIQTYEAYKLICKGNPQKYYGIRTRHTIEIVNCLTKNAHITLHDGSTKQITKLQIGDKVLSKGDEGLQPSKVCNIWCSGKKSILEIKTGNRTLEASPGHKFYKLLSGINPAHPRTAAWVTADTLRKGDYIGILTEVPDLGNTQTSRGELVTEDMMEQLGLYIGDGSLYKNFVSIALPDTDPKKELYMQQAARSWPTKRKFKDGRATHVGSHKAAYNICTGVASDFIRNNGFGKGARGKQLPTWVFGLKRDLKIAFLNGVIHSDGHITEATGKKEIALVNKKLIYDLRALAISVGWSVCNVRKQYVKSNYGDNINWGFEISPRGTNKQFKNHKIGKSIEWTRIRNITNLTEQTTYDIEIEDTHNFFANGIFVHNCAKDGEQAKSPFALTKDNIKRIEFFQSYIDHTKDNESELRLFTPADVYANNKIIEYNSTKQKGMPKKNLLEGSLLISAITTSAASKRGKATICLTFDEFAHFDRAKVTAGNITDQDILTEMPQTDYAMFKALTPSVKDFKKDGKILCISSPREKGGEFYKLYCEAGGREQPNPDIVTPDPNYLMLQLSTWEANPNQPQEGFDSNFKKDPVGANMEYGSHFGDPSSTFIDSTKVDAMVDVEKKFTTEGIYGFSYIIAVDPASTSDTYAVAWGHCEDNRGNPRFHIDGVFGFRPEIIVVPGSKPRKLPIDPEKVTKFITNLAASLTRTGGKVLEICYDQWSSAQCIFTLQKLGYPAFETRFTNAYKGKMYGDFLEKLNMGQVISFGAPPQYSASAYQVEYFDGWLEQTKLEIKFLQQEIQGNTTFYHAPTSGPVLTDDFGDVTANVVHRLALRRSPDSKTMRELYKQVGRPIQTRSGVRPVHGSSGFFRGNPMTNIKTRVFWGRK